MIILEQITNQILREEGQILISLSDLGITWDDIEQLFIGVYEQSKGYLSIYDWTDDVIGLTPQKREEYSHIRHMTYNAYYQRFMPDVPDSYWEFNPYTKNTSALMNTNFSLEVGKYPTLDNLEYAITLNNIKKGKTKTFTLPFIVEDMSVNETNSINEFNIELTEIDQKKRSKNQYLDNTKDCFCQEESSNIVQISGDLTGELDPNTFKGSLKFNKDYNSIDINLTSKYVGIKELEMNCELFYVWYKAALLSMIGAVKKQIDLSGAGLPFDFNQDALLERARDLMNKVEELKANKSHWSNF